MHSFSLRMRAALAARLGMAALSARLCKGEVWKRRMGACLYPGLLQEGFHLASFEEIAQNGGLSSNWRPHELVEALWRDESFSLLRMKACNSTPRDKEDDPTSLGVQFFSKRSSLTKIAAFGSVEMMRSLKDPSSSFLLDSDAAEETGTMQTLPPLVRALAEEITASLSEGSLTILSHILPGPLIDSPLRRRLESGECNHETLINFFSSHPAPMYPHVDHSTITLLIIPSLWYASVPPTGQSSNMDGLRVETTVGHWRNIEEEMWNSLRDTSFDLWRARIVLVLLGNHLTKFQPSLGIRAAPHRVAASRRHASRVSLAHFMHRDLVRSSADSQDGHSYE